MSNLRILTLLSLALLLFASIAMAESEIKMKLSGEGVVNDSTVKAGEPFSMDLYFSNDKDRRGMSLGFKLYSKDIKDVIHVADSGNGVNENGDVKAYNGWEDKSVWDFSGLLATMEDWNGSLPDTIGFAGVVIKKRYGPHEMERKISMDMIVPEPGVLMVDSTFFPPGGKWKFDDDEKPGWDGPYTIHVVK